MISSSDILTDGNIIDVAEIVDFGEEKCRSSRITTNT